MEKPVGVKFTDKANGGYVIPRTTHRIVLGDAREMPEVATDSVHLVVTSPQYWTLKEYKENPAQLGATEDYDRFLKEETAA